MTKIHIMARLHEDDGSSFLAKVPLVITTIPEVPQAVTIGVRVYTLTITSPLQYTRVTSTKAERKK
jgi:hypothetical protein